MTAEYQCPICGQMFRDWTVEAVRKRVSDHSEAHHGASDGLADAEHAVLRGQVGGEAA